MPDYFGACSLASLGTSPPISFFGVTSISAHNQATSKLRVGDADIHTGEENGPVSALDLALRKALIER